MFCRLCLEKDSKPFSSIFADDISAKIKECTSLDVEIDMNFPTKLCSSCLQKLNISWHFLKMCLKSNEILHNAQQNNTLLQYTVDNSTIQEWSESDEYSDKTSEVLSAGNYTEITGGKNVFYSCEICEKKFDQILEYLDHQHEHDGKPVFKCTECELILSRRQDLVEHEQNHKIPCLTCGKLMKKSSMKLHLISHTDKFKCVQCSQTCSSKTALDQHKTTVHTNIKAFICENCGKNFSTPSSLRSHLLSHGKERKYACKLCDYAGRTASAIYIHMSKHAQDTCVCEVCSKVFKSNRNLNDHIRRVHCKVKNYICSYCSRQFVDHYMLKVHLRIHTGCRPYNCDQCDKSFFRSDGLKEHMVIHKERTMYDCVKCNKQYLSKRGVTRHICSGIKNV